MSNKLISDEEFNVKNSINSINNSQVEIPSENGISTIRPLDNNLDNVNLLSDFQNVDNSINNNVSDCFTGELPKTLTLSDLLKNLCELMIRFDTNPKNYQKADFEHFIKTITNSLIYLYDKDNINTSYTGTDSASFIGIAELNTNPFVDAINLNNRFPGIYFAQNIGEYTSFGLEVTNDDLHNNIVLLIPNIVNGQFIDYKSEIYKLNINNNSFKYSSDIKKSVWEINHNLNRLPSVVITDTGGTVFEGGITHIDNNNLTITFSAPFKGYADLN